MAKANDRLPKALEVIGLMAAGAYIWQVGLWVYQSFWRADVEQPTSPLFVVAPDQPQRAPISEPEPRRTGVILPPSPRPKLPRARPSPVRPSQQGDAGDISDRFAMLEIDGNEDEPDNKSGDVIGTSDDEDP